MKFMMWRLNHHVALQWMWPYNGALLGQQGTRRSGLMLSPLSKEGMECKSQVLKVKWTNSNSFSFLPAAGTSHVLFFVSLITNSPLFHLGHWEIRPKSKFRRSRFLCLLMLVGHSRVTRPLELSSLLLLSLPGENIKKLKMSEEWSLLQSVLKAF